MTGRILVIFANVILSPVLAGCVSLYDVSIETPRRARLDLSSFQRVLVAGFIEAGTGEVDANVETVRVLRSQLRSKTSLRVIEGADILPLDEIAAEKMADMARPAELKSEKGADVHSHIFADVTFWKQLGEEYQGALIVTGTVVFTMERRDRVVRSDREIFDNLGRRSVDQREELVPSTAYVLKPTFIFIDGRTGVVIHSETFREEVVYDEKLNVPALSSYFELIDRVLPGFLGTVADQKMHTTRVLLR